MKIILNHKSNLTYKEIINYYKEYKELDTKHDLIVCPTTCYLPIFKDVVLGSQDISPYKMGSYTGEVSGEALKSLGVKYVFINHSERRHLNNEPLELAKEKLIRAKEADLIPILCVGEEDGEDAVEVLTHDLNYLLKDLNIDIASEYLVMAADLIHIKSKKLINKELESENKEEETFIESEEDLKKKLKMYEQYKKIGESLSKLEENRKDYYTKLPENLS